MPSIESIPRLLIAVALIAGSGAFAPVRAQDVPGPVAPKTKPGASTKARTPEAKPTDPESKAKPTDPESNAKPTDPESEARPTDARLSKGSSRLHTDRKSSRRLAMPAERDSWHFVIYGDRTGGTRAGLKVLRQAVTDTNLLDPDLVMTVGDLVQGYNETPEWLKEAKEFKGIMGGLRMPWFPVAGNHDVYWRGKGKPPQGHHESNFETHFGPLWYWFKHKNAGFVVLYTDEGDRKTNRKGFTDPALTRMSDEQLAWLEKALKEASGLKHVFVFVHHPRWINVAYPAGDWDRVHKRLKAAGNVRAVFAGHIHRMVYSGVRDGIEYFALATTGGGLSRDFPEAGFLHHMNLVTVRDSGISTATIPVGTVMDPKTLTEARMIELETIFRALKPKARNPLVLGREATSGTALYELRNPAPKPIDVTVRVRPRGSGFRFAADHLHLRLDPGESKRLRFPWSSRPGALLDNGRSPELVLAVEYLDEGWRVKLPELVFRMTPKLGELPVDAWQSKVDRALRIRRRRQAVAIPEARRPLGDEPFTIEVRVAPDGLADLQPVVACTEGSGYGLFLRDGRPEAWLRVGRSYLIAGAREPLKVKRFSALAMVFDGARLRLFVDGQPVASRPVKGKVQVATKPLMVGADPDRSGRPGLGMKGWIDELRISTGARYAKAYEPQRRLEADDTTTVLLHFDRELGPFLLDHGPARDGLERLGGARCLPFGRTAKAEDEAREKARKKAGKSDRKKDENEDGKKEKASEPGAGGSKDKTTPKKGSKPKGRRSF